MAVLVPNARDAEVLIDDCDADDVLRLAWQVYHHRGRDWCIHNYKRGGVQASIALHRYVMRALPDEIVDHINGNTFDNRRENLRFASASGNARNRRALLGGSSQYKGVTRASARSWRAYIHHSGQQFHLGTHRTEVAAAEAYDCAARAHFGEFASLNFPQSSEIAAHRPVSMLPIAELASAEGQ